MRLMRLHLLAAVAVLAITVPAPAAVVFEWHQIAAIGSGPAANAPLATNADFNPDPLAGGGLLNMAPGQVVFLQLMVRDNNAGGNTFPWAYGDGLVPPPASENINGVGLFGLGAGVRGTPGTFAVGGNTSADRRLVVIPDSENPIFGTTGVSVQPYSGPIWTPQAAAGGMDFQVINNLADDNPFESGDFPRQRPGSTSFLMPYFNMRFVAGAGGTGTLTLIDARPGATNEDNQVGGDNGTTLAVLDTQLFGASAPVVNVSIVPEPSSFLLVGVAVAGLWKARRRKTAA